MRIRTKQNKEEKKLTSKRRRGFRKRRLWRNIRIYMGQRLIEMRRFTSSERRGRSLSAVGLKLITALENFGHVNASSM
jgi:hypothetical protein